MAWSERQHRMLRAMGLRPCTPPGAGGVAAPATSTSAEPPPMPLVAPSEPGRAARTATATAAPVTRTPQLQAKPVHTLGPAAATGALDERVLALSSLDWPALRATVSQCTACALSQGRQQTVFGTGHPQARWLVVGEAPGEQEDLSGEPFVGAAGQLLDRMLAALHLTRAEDGPHSLDQRVYITNTLKCRPPRNRNPLAEESAQCQPFLVRQVELLQPRIILAMGRFAVQSLLQTDEPIGRLRGRVHSYQGRPLVVTYHPAYLLRNVLDKAKAWEDLCLAAQVFETGARP